MSITIYYDRSYAFGTVLEYAIGSCTWHRVYEIYPRPPRAADQFPSLSAAGSSPGPACAAALMRARVYY
mgnify:CR=1 FL=1